MYNTQHEKDIHPITGMSRFHRAREAYQQAVCSPF